MQESPSLSTLEVLLLVCICLQHAGTYHINAVYVQCGSLVALTSIDSGPLSSNVCVKIRVLLHRLSKLSNVFIVCNWIF